MIETADLEALERSVATAVRSRDSSGLNLLGHGEISLALGWPVDDPRYACKRLPPFDSQEQYRAYAAVVERYIAELQQRGVRVVETELRSFVRPDGRVAGFHVQPALPPDSLGIEILRGSTPSAAHPLLGSVVDTVVGATTARVGIDAQLSNWSWKDEEVWQLDLTTPFLFDESGRPRLDLDPFLAVLPAVLRPLVRQEMVKLMRRWMTPRGALLDMAANVIKARLDGWLDPVLERVNERVDPPVTREEAQRIYTDDRRLWPWLLRLQRANRLWQERVRRRPFEFLLPEHTTYEEPVPT